MKRHLAALAVVLLLTQLFTVSNSLAQAPQGILISQYYEGFSGNKYIEIWNPTDNEVILLGIRITLWSNSNRENWKTGTGAPTASLDLGSISPGRTLKPGQFLLIANPSAVSPTYAANTADARAEKAGEQIANFNGDDSIVLYSSDMYAPDNILDSFSLSSNSAADKSFYRISTGKGYDLSPQSQSSDFSSVWAEKAITDVNLASPADDFYLTASSALSVPATKVPPTVIIKSATMRGATGLMDVVFRVNDPDDATVKTRALAFIDGQRSFAKVIKPTTFAEGTESKLGDTIASNTDHTLTWNVAADWNISLGQIKFEILAMDTRGLLPFDWVTIPAANGQPELTISKNAPTDQQTLDALFWQYASGDPGLKVENGTITASETSGAFAGRNLARGSTPFLHATPYLLSRMNLATADHIEMGIGLRSRGISDQSGYHACRKSFPGKYPLVGRVKAWGDNSKYQCSVPENLFLATRISAGPWHSIAIGYDGKLYGWGEGFFWGDPAIKDSEFIPIPEDILDAVEVSAGYSHNLAIRSNGTVIAWGDNGSGACDVPQDLTDVKSVEAGYGYSLALKNDGTVVSWGRQGFGNNYVYSVPQGLTNITALSDSKYNGVTLALKSDGTVVAWGPPTHSGIVVPPGLRNVVSISAGGRNMALLADGSVFFWPSVFQTAPNYAKDIAAGIDFSLVIKKAGNVEGESGYNDYHPPGTGSSPNPTMISAGWRHSLALETEPAP